MPSAKTEITEIVTGLAITGAPTIEAALAERAVANVGPEVWDRLDGLHRAGGHRVEFAAAWANGQAFLAAEEGLRGRPPRVVEWKGPTQAPGDEVVPADLRVDHVWLVSCKYLTKVLANSAPARLFDRGLAGGPIAHGRRLVRRGRARRLPGALRAWSAPSSARARRSRPTPPTSRRLTAPSCGPTSTRGGRLTRRPPTRASPPR